MRETARPRRRWFSVLLVALLALGVAAATATATSPGRNGKIAFVRGGDIWAMGPDGSSPVRLTNSPGRALEDTDPAWSPDGTRIAFVRAGINGDLPRDIYVLRVGASATLVARDGTGPSWSPNGARLTFVRERIEANSFPISYFWVVNADGTGAHRISPAGQAGWLFAGHTDWSPLGDLIAFDSGDEETSVAFVDRNGGFGGGVPGGGTQSFDLRPSWAPDATAIALDRFQASECAIPFSCTPDDAVVTKLIVADRHGGTRIVIANAAQPAWSPDGARIAFVSRVGGVRQIRTMRIDGSDARTLTSSPSGSSEPTWQATRPGLRLGAPRRVAAGKTFALTLTFDQPVTGLPIQVQSQKGAPTQPWVKLRGATVGGRIARLDLRITAPGDYRLRVTGAAGLLPLQGSLSIPVTVG
jgi:dipeptidyl aminopeptidase/acylaminoacyl peptidase